MGNRVGHQGRLSRRNIRARCGRCHWSPVLPAPHLAASGHCLHGILQLDAGAELCNSLATAELTSLTSGLCTTRSRFKALAGAGLAPLTLSSNRTFM